MPETEIACPVCQSPLVFDATLLVRGDKITCGTCDTAIGIEPGGNTKATMEAFAAARRTAEALKVERKKRG
ncbi:hypothetical protein [Parerythrobacter aestuarii]|uniref:hypothetical protein n=1 Tax=Parerythrobacter aestuarii TaxID=3020909 RepID=UPI0024DEC814|nr:hypothetical protein [Parerythrobacter aestuarii]